MKAEEAIVKYDLNKKTWMHKGFHGILHFFFAVGEQPIKPLKGWYGDGYKITVFFFHDNLGEWYWNNEDMIRLRKSFIEKVNKDQTIMQNLLDEWNRRIARFNKVMDKIDKTDLTTYSDNALLKLYYEWYNAYLTEYGIAIGIQDAFSMHAEDFLLSYFKEIIIQRGEKKKFNEYYTLLMSPREESFFTREYRERLEILNAEKQGKPIDLLIKKHVQRWHWIHNNYAKDIFLDEKYFCEELEKIKEKDPEREKQRLNKEREKLRKKKAIVIKKLKLDMYAQNLIKIIELFAYMQDERKKYVLIATHYQYLFMNEFGKRLHLEKRQMEYTFIHELKELLKTKKSDTQLFDERRKFVCVINTEKKYEIIAGKAAEEIFTKVFKKEEKEVESFKGMIASSGYAKGRVKIVRKIHDIINVQEGDILVASMTRPEMVVAMEKAAAIVTDEGGVTCHAAVVSRELKKPCIISTKIATTTLKEGDFVEVDANNGIVKRIKSES